MAITYNWKVDRLDCFPNKDGKENVVFTIFWSVEASDGTHTTSAFGSQMIEFDSTGNFTPYAHLTQDQVIGWVKSVMDFNRPAEIEANLATAIENLINPPVVSPPLPWV